MTVPDSPTLQETVDVVRRSFLPAVVAAVVVGVVTFATSDLRSPSFEARATVVVTAQEPDQAAFGTTLVMAPALAPSAYRAAALGRDVLATAYRTAIGTEPGTRDVVDLRSRLQVRIEQEPTSSLIRIFARAASADEAKALADAVALALRDWDRARAARILETTVASLAAQLDAIDQELAIAAPDEVTGLQRARAEVMLQRTSARALLVSAVGRAEVFELAARPSRATRPQPLRDALIGALAAATLIIGLYLLWAALDPRVRGPEDLAAAAEAPILAVFPRQRANRAAVPARSASYLRTAVAAGLGERYPMAVLVSAIGHGHGATSVSIALASAFARQGRRTVLLDANLRSPGVAAVFGLRAGTCTSLEEALMTAPILRPGRVDVGEHEGFDVLPTFRPLRDPSRLLSDRMAVVLDELQDTHEVVILDTPPLVHGADALAMGPLVSGVVITASVARSERRAVERALAIARGARLPVLGVAATHARKAHLVPWGHAPAAEGRPPAVRSERAIETV